MMAELAKAVKSQFVTEMAKRLPGFAALGDNRNGDLLGLRVSESLVFFVHLSIADDKDCFVLEVASNTLDVYPWKLMPGQVRDVTAAAARDAWRFRISKLWGETKEQWCVLGQEPDRHQRIERLRNRPHSSNEDLPRKLNDVEPTVREAVGRVCRYAVPYFESAARQHGHDLKIEVVPL